MIGNYFLDSCLNSTVINEPWGHQIINDNLQTSQTDIELVSENETALGHDDGEKVPSRQNKK